MSWLFSRALVEAFSEDTCSDGAPSALSSGSPTPQAYLPPDRMTAFSRPSRFGMTFSPLTADRGEELLTSYLAAFPAWTSAWQVREQASTEPAAGCGDTWRGSLARFDPDTSSWRTAQRCLLEDSRESLVTWPRSGMTADGQCWELPTLEHRTSGTGSGCAPNGETFWHTPNTNGLDGDGLATAVAMSLTTICLDATDAPIAKAQTFPTPCTSDWKGSSKPGQRRGQLTDPDAGAIPAGGSLNPTWVEWLMGWPLGWTDLKPLATDKSPCAQPQHGTS
jgi:hypothetical protein